MRPRWYPLRPHPAGKPLPPVRVLAARTGEASRGAEVFTRLCSTCHVVRGQGTDFGPDRSEIGTKLPKEALLTEVLQQSAGISFGYEGYVFALRDGSRVAGYVTSETAGEVAVRLPGGVTRRYATADIVSRTPLEASLMPAGLHQALTEDELVDLITFLSTLREDAP